MTVWADQRDDLLVSGLDHEHRPSDIHDWERELAVSPETPSGRVADPVLFAPLGEPDHPEISFVILMAIYG